MQLGGKTPTRFARKVARVLFTTEEFINHYLTQEGNLNGIFHFFVGLRPNFSNIH